MSNVDYIHLLRQYREGTISAADRHILEVAALDDPMLFDAMEGYTHHGSPIDSHNIDSLLQKSASQSKPKVVWFNRRLISVAASLVVLIAITFLVQYGLKDNEPKITQVAVNEDKDANQYVKKGLSEVLTVDIEDTIIQQNESITFNDNKVEDIRDFKKESSNQKESTTNWSAKKQKGQSDHVSQDNEFDISDDDAVSNDVSSVPSPTVESDAMMMAEDDDLDEVRIVQMTPSSDFRAKNSGGQVSNSNALSDKITGKIINESQIAIADATINIENTDIRVVSNSQGQFEIPIYPPGHKLSIMAEGFIKKEMVLSDQFYYEVQLQEISSNVDTKVQINIVDEKLAYPIMGMEALELFIKDNIKYPIEVFGTAASSQITVSFQVNLDGSLSNFINETQVCDSCFKEAVRLLKASGMWETIPSRTIYRTMYNFQF